MNHNNDNLHQLNKSLKELQALAEKLTKDINWDLLTDEQKSKLQNELAKLQKQ